MAESRKKAPVSFFYSRFISIISISLSLFLMGLFLLFGLLGNELSVYMKENISFSIILKDGMRDSEVEKLQKTLDAMPFIKSSRYISKADAAKEMIAELGEDPQVFLGFNPFHSALEAKLNSEYANIDSLSVIEKRLSAETNITEMLYQQDMMQIVNSNIRRIGAVLSVLILVLMIISFALINNTIRLLIYSKRFLIYTMRLVGATPGFIQKPFIKYNITSGFFAGLLAIFMLAGALFFLQRELVGLDQIIRWEGLVIIGILILALGIILSVATASLAVNRYLKMKRGKMYYI
ncbi:MAG: permease-like cell division protein FtsX [Tannerella sp.]|jgi:cell division transport system permease protein|nr:permease-like cell division protein FtsX [Tannerella sp.]